MPTLTEIYGYKYHEGIHKTYRGKTAARMYNAIMSVYKDATSIIELGCSCGVLLEPFHRAGMDVMGVEGDPAAFTDDIRCIPMDKCMVHDLRKPFVPSKKFDICYCGETLEHIEPDYMDIAIDSICACSDHLFLTIAAPGQGGVGHVNLRPLSEWQAKFAKRGYRKRKRLPKAIASWPTLLVMEKIGGLGGCHW